jgi:uncharacterized membrane protein YdjX (TVP38/TMEM64 family)/rhodanese-related sulfurtransferase
MKRRTLWLRFTLAAALLGAAAYVWANGELRDAERLQRVVIEFGSFAPLVFVAIYALATVLFLPGSVMTVAGGAAFGPVLGTLWNLLGATLGATAAFLIARYIASPWVARKAGERLSRIIKGVESQGWRFVALVRLVPIFPFNLTNYALGLTRIALVEYVAASFVCMIPGAFVYTYLGYSGREALAGHAGALRQSLFALGLLAGLIFLSRRWRLRRRPRFVEVHELGQQLACDAKPLVLDVRGSDEFAGPLGHIAGARNIPLNELQARLTEVNEAKKRLVVLVCLTDKRSASAAAILQETGFEQVAVLRGGMKLWNEAGMPIERGNRPASIFPAHSEAMGPGA